MTSIYKEPLAASRLQSLHALVASAVQRQKCFASTLIEPIFESLILNCTELVQL